MEKNTILAIVLSAVILTVGMFLSQMFNQNYVQEESATQPISSEEPASNKAAGSVKSNSVPEAADSANFEETAAAGVSGLPEQNYPIKEIIEETDLFRIKFNTAGGVASDIELIQQLEEFEPITMVLDDGLDIGTFNVAFGGPDSASIKDAFSHERTTNGNEINHIFSRNYIQDGQIFTMIKNYRIIPGEYLIELRIVLETPDGKSVPLLNGDEPAYTLTYGPQIGPSFKKIDGRYVIRQNVTWGPNGRNGKYVREEYSAKNGFAETNDVVNWAGVVGKYFAVLVAPDSGSSTISWNTRAIEGMAHQPSQLQISRPARRQSVIEDVYRFYIGPLDREILGRYENADDNAFGVAEMSFTRAPKASAALGWLQTILRWVLEFFAGFIPNYGIAIILLTLVVKALMFPLTHKSYESTSKMQAIQPRMKELQAQYKDEPRKLNVKMAELYKQEGVNPMGGCLPMLLQFPIFIALYGLLNSYFPLRGAVFIPGWITDLSAPEFIWKEFANPINLLFIEIPAIRILPVLYLAAQLLTTKVTQQNSASAQSNVQQKMLTIGMPIMFFFILYNMPSGLLLYWTVMNFVTILQQLAVNYFKKRKAAGGTA